MSLRSITTPESQLVALNCQDDKEPTILEKIAQQEGIPTNELRKIIAIYFRGYTEHEYLIDSQSGANADAFSENIKPILPNSILRFFVIPSFSSGAPTLNVVIDTPQKQGITGLALSGDILETDTAYTFDVQTKKGFEYNLQTTAAVTWSMVLVTELTP